MAAPAKRPLVVTVGDPAFENGEVAKAKGSLERHRAKLGRCVEENGGIRGSRGSLEVQFLVRAAGIAEGVDVLEAKAIGAEAKRCVRDALQRTRVGTPSSDPVGVTVMLDFVPSPEHP